MEVVYSLDGFELLKYKPSIIRPFYDNMEKLTLFRRARFIIEYFYGYNVYYLKSEAEIVGYCTVSSGRNSRYWFADENDIIIGPYFIKENNRGKGLSTVMLDMVLHHAGISYHYAYDYINKDNLPSIKVTQRLNGKKILDVNINVITRRMKQSDSGEYGVYRIS